MRVLAADDDPKILELLERCLRSWGYEVILAKDGIEAWGVLRSADAPGLAVLDWDMPALSGLEVCRLLRTAPHAADVYVLVLTGRTEKEDLIEALESGADDFLAKPFHLRELQLRLAKGVTFQQRRRATARGTRGRATPSGSILGGKYRLEKKIAEGGMADVWLGVHLALGIPVAIKFMKPGLTGSDYPSFEREARAAAQLRSEHIVRIYDHGIAHDGSPYLVMEYLEGESLSDRVDRRGPLPLAEVAALIDQVARALTEAHARGVIHRDVKPDNILLVDDPDHPFGCAKLVDFGLARSRAPSDSTQARQISGTPNYMAPEQLCGQATPTPGLDLWALAASALTALTGTVPFDGDSLSEIVKSICRAPPPVPSCMNPALGPAIDAWFARACARSPEDRFPTAAELSSAFGAACASSARSSGRDPSARLLRDDSRPQLDTLRAVAIEPAPMFLSERDDDDEDSRSLVTKHVTQGVRRVSGL